MSTKMCRSIYRPTYRSSIGRYVDSVTLDRYVAYRSICRPRVVVRLSADMSIDRLPTFRRYFTATCVLVTVDIIFAAQISLIYSPLLRGFFVYNPACLSSVLYQHLVILHRPYPLSCQLYFVYLAVSSVSCLITTEFAAHEGRA